MRIKSVLFVVPALGGLFTAVHPAFAQTSAPAGNWISVASSADGTKLVAVAYADASGTNGGPIFTSADSGATWIATSAPQSYWWAVASSANGTKLVALESVPGSYPGRIYVSTDSGASWVPTSAPYTNWQAIASSADGTKLVAATQFGPIYTSTDSGANWSVMSAFGYWQSVASSADGTKLVAVGYHFGPLPQVGQICTSTNSGATWTQTNSYNDWVSVASSADGTTLVAAAQNMYYQNFFYKNGRISKSTDSGATWTDILSTAWSGEGWRGVASSADGTRLIAMYHAGDGGGILASPISGTHWRSLFGSRYWLSVASSADGNKLVAAGGGQIFTSQTTPAPVLSITPSSTNARLSWTIPSLDFTLQQNSDLMSAGVQKEITARIQKETAIRQ